MPPKKHSSSLSKLWNAIQKISAIIGFSTFIEDIFGKAVKWKGFINETIQCYRAILSSIFEFILGWVNLVPPIWLQDYLILGLIIFGIAYKWFKTTPGMVIRTFRTLFWVCIFIWPIFIGWVATATTKSQLRERSTVFWGDLGTVLLGFLLLLAINAQL